MRGVAQAQRPPPHERAARTSIGRTQQRPCAAQAPVRGATCAALLAPRSGWAREEPNRGGRDCSWVPEACRQWGTWTRPSRSCPRTDYTLQILPTRLQATRWRYAPDLSRHIGSRSCCLDNFSDADVCLCVLLWASLSQSLLSLALSLSLSPSYLHSNLSLQHARSQIQVQTQKRHRSEKNNTFPSFPLLCRTMLMGRISRSHPLSPQNGATITPTQTQDQPTIAFQAEPGALYSIVMTDPDVPSRRNPSR